MTVLTFIKLVQATRHAQKEYFRLRTKTALSKALEKEYQLDKVLKTVEIEIEPEKLDNQLSLFE
jgi:hypothetical protein